MRLGGGTVTRARLKCFFLGGGVGGSVGAQRVGAVHVRYGMVYDVRCGIWSDPGDYDELGTVWYGVP